ncbi:hypothetical protein P7K49_001496, partial [Saguinus oedipus]
SQRRRDLGSVTSQPGLAGQNLPTAGGSPGTEKPPPCFRTTVLSPAQGLHGLLE